MTITKSLMILALAAGMASSCKDKEPDPTKTSLLINKNWKLTASNMKIKSPSVDATVDDYARMDACEKDDITKYSAASETVTSGSYVSDGKVKCNPSETNESGTWSFNSNQTELIIDGDAAKILELSSKTMKVEHTETDTDDGVTTTYTTTSTFTAQ